MEALGEAQETADFFTLYAEDFEQQRTVSTAPLPDDPLREATSRTTAASCKPVRRLGRDRAVQLPAGARRRSDRGRARHRQHGRRQGRQRHTLGRPPARRLHRATPACRRGVQLPQRPGPRWSARRWSRTRTSRASPSPVRTRSACASARQLAGGAYPRPCIAEMGGKNACIVTRHADLSARPTGIVRSALRHGRTEVLGAVAPVRRTSSVADGADRVAAGSRSPASESATRRAASNWLGPVTTAAAHATMPGYCEQLRADGATHPQRAARSCARASSRSGFFVAPDARRGATRASAVEAGDVPADPDAAPRRSTATRRCASRTTRRSDSRPASTAALTRSAWFHERIEAGVTYANRPQGATTGAWPGYQPFGGWKGSGSTGKAIALVLLPAAVPARAVADRGRVSTRCRCCRLAKRSRGTCHDGASVALEGFTHLIPFAAGHEIIRQRRRDLHLIRMTPGPDLRPDDRRGLRAQADLLLGRQSRRRLAAPAARCDRARLAAAARHHRAHATPAWRAAYAPVRRRPALRLLRGYAGTDLAARRARASAAITCPFTGETLRAVPAINPDVTILHAQAADRAGQRR